LGIYRIISGAFGAFRMDALKKVGVWDIGPGLDGDITVKLRKSGYKIHFEPTAICLTAVPTKFKVLWKQRLRWSRSLVRFRLRKHLDVFLPHKNWRWGTFLGFVENIFYNLIAGFMQQLSLSLWSERSDEERVLWWYVPLMVFYVAFFLRFCRTLAYFKEFFFKASYRDPWNPQKSSYQALKNGY